MLDRIERISLFVWLYACVYVRLYVRESKRACMEGGGRGRPGGDYWGEGKKGDRRKQRSRGAGGGEEQQLAGCWYTIRNQSTPPLNAVRTTTRPDRLHFCLAIVCYRATDSCARDCITSLVKLCGVNFVRQFISCIIKLEVQWYTSLQNKAITQQNNHKKKKFRCKKQ